MARRRKSAKVHQTDNQDIVEYLITYRWQFVGWGLLISMGYILFTLLGADSGSAGAMLLTDMFGWGAIMLAGILFILGFFLAIGHRQESSPTISVEILVALQLLIAGGMAVQHNITQPLPVTATAEASSSSFISGPWLTVGLVGLITAAFGGLFIGLLLRKQLAQKTQAAKTERLTKPPTGNQLVDAQSVNLAKHQIETFAPPPPQTETISLLNRLLIQGTQLLLPFQGSNGNGDYAHGNQAAPAPKKAVVVETEKSTLPQSRHQSPSLDLLAPVPENMTYNSRVEYQAQVIEETLASFDIPVKVVKRNVGPTVTQFGLKLGVLERRMADGSIRTQRIRVRKVLTLIDDLALALSASPIRIDAPIAGSSLIGIEVPNPTKSVVSLRGVLADKAFEWGKPLQVAFGRGVSGKATVVSLAKMPHLLIAGATGSGKSVCLNTIIASLLFTHSPEQLRLLMIDPKMVELTSYNGIPHLVAPVVTDFEQVVGALAWATREMERRYKQFSKRGVRNITDYNRKVQHADEQLPYLVVMIDELADLMMMAPDEVERHICRIAQMARATGIHLVIATQRPSTDVVTGLIKANFPARITFAVTSQIDSRVIIDTPGAEKLLGQGDMLYMAPDSAKLQRLQGCYVSDEEIKNLVNYWKRASLDGPSATRPPHDLDMAEEMPWDDILEEADKDDLLDEAITIVTETRRASTSYLQRRLSIGYTRAARLMDQMEEEGIVGPANGRQPRELLVAVGEDELVAEEP